MKWIDVEDIVELLRARYPTQDVGSLRFVHLKGMVLGLDGFNDHPDRCNERILEAIQAQWLESQND